MPCERARIEHFFVTSTAHFPIYLSQKDETITIEAQRLAQL